MIHAISISPSTLELYASGDVEAQFYADFFRKVFKKAKWSLREYTLSGGLSASGVELADAMGPNILQLSKIFRNCRVDFVESPEPSPENYTLIIGTKPTIILH